MVSGTISADTLAVLKKVSDTIFVWGAKFVSDTNFVADGNHGEMARLRWRCRRGMRELDRILERFLETGFLRLGAEEKLRFAEILEFPDPDLHAYLLGRAEPADPELARLLHAIRHCGTDQA